MLFLFYKFSFMIYLFFKILIFLCYKKVTRGKFPLLQKSYKGQISFVTKKLQEKISFVTKKLQGVFKLNSIKYK
jgi:hypothetical protein